MNLRTLCFLFNPQAKSSPRTHSANELTDTELIENFYKNISSSRLHAPLSIPLGVSTGFSTGLTQGFCSLTLGILLAEMTVKLGMHYSLTRELKKRGKIKSIHDMYL